MKLRAQHKLAEITSSDRPTRVIFFDTETNQIPLAEGEFRHTLKLGYAVKCVTRRGEILRKQEECLFYDMDTFWNLVDRCCSGNTTTYLVSHNLNFDLPVLYAFSRLHALGFTLSQFYVQATIGIFTWVRGKTKLKAIDNGNFYSGKLARWGDILELPKLSIDFDNDPDSELIEYCKRDVEIIYRLWLMWYRFLDENDCGPFKLTVSATSLSTYRHSFMKHKIFIHNNEPTLAMEREAYKGGRVEVIRKGYFDEYQYYYLDVNNMYGWAMAYHNYPTCYWDSVDNPTLTKLAYRLNTGCAIASVHLSTDSPDYPVIRNHRLIYPTGDFNAVLSTPELVHALARNRINEIHTLAHYASAPIFTAFVHHFFMLRKAYKERGDTGMEQICKLLINSLYGKFGQRGIEQSIIGECDVDMIGREKIYYVDEQKYIEHISIGGSVFANETTGEAYNSFPAIASHVTAYARMRLQTLKSLCPIDSVYYMDTDSLIVDSRAIPYLKHEMSETELGKLKIELQSSWLEINAPKDYKMENRTRTKGVKADTTLLEENKFVQDLWPKLRGMIQRGELDGYTTRQTVKHLSRDITSGLLQSDGRVVPFHLME